MARDLYVLELAETVNEIFASGNTDPSAEEIAEAHFPGRALGGEIIEGIRKRLRRVRDVLEVEYRQPVYLLSYTYYTRYRKTPPPTEAEARRCIPGGYHVPSAGIRLHTDDGDLIYQAKLGQDFSSGAGKLKKSADRTLDAVEESRLEEESAGRLMRRAQRQAQPENLALAAKVTGELPGGLPGDET